MKASRILALASVCIMILTGCDAIRSALGKPTSKDIEALRQQRAQMQRTSDSLDIEMGVDTTLTAYSDTIANGIAALNPEAAPQAVEEAVQEPALEEEAAEVAQDTSANTLQDGFYVVLGSFKNEDNARYFYNSISASGTDVKMVKMKNGFTAVMICHGDTYEESYRKMREFYGDGKCPEDAWIYNTNKKMHVQ